MIKTTNDHLMLSAFGKTVYWVKGVGGGGGGGRAGGGRWPLGIPYLWMLI